MRGDVPGRLRTAAPEVFGDEQVTAAYLFGSHATGRASERSDIDIAVLLPEDADPLDALLRLPGLIEERTGLRRIEVVVLNDAPLSLRGRVVTEGIAIYSADEPARVRFEGTTRKLHHDFEIHGAEMRRTYLRNIAAGRA